MNFTILGASGFIGRHLVASLRADGHAVQMPERGSTSLLRQPLGHVIYCIGLTADFRSRPYDTVQAHVGLLADVLRQADFDSLLYLSSTRVYARSAAGVEDAALPVDVADPSDLYNLSKLAGESLCRSCGRSGVRVARLSNVVGHDPGSQNFLAALVREALAGRIVLQSDPASSKDYILLDDVVRLLPRIAVDGRDWIYNVASGIKLSHGQVAARLAELTGCAVASQAAAPAQSFPEIDIARIRSEFNYRPSPVLEVLPQLVDSARRAVTP